MSFYHLVEVDVLAGDGMEAFGELAGHPGGEDELVAVGCRTVAVPARSGPRRGCRGVRAIHPTIPPPVQRLTEGRPFRRAGHAVPGFRPVWVAQRVSLSRRS
jgi:hypothetical protein